MAQLNVMEVFLMVMVTDLTVRVCARHAINEILICPNGWRQDGESCYEMIPENETNHVTLCKSMAAQYDMITPQCELQSSSANDHCLKRTVLLCPNGWKLNGIHGYKLVSEDQPNHKTFFQELGSRLNNKIPACKATEFSKENALPLQRFCDKVAAF